MVVDDILGVVKDVPVPKEEPPVGLANQLIVPKLVVADKFKVPASHLESPVTLVIVVFVKAVAVTLVREAVVQVAVAACT